jgi:hypothetical protein
MPLTSPEMYMQEPRQSAAQCWCDEETKHMPLNLTLAEDES